MLKELSPWQREEVEQQLPAVLQKKTVENDSDILFTEDVAESSEKDEHTFFRELRNLALSALELPASENGSATLVGNATTVENATAAASKTASAVKSTERASNSKDNNAGSRKLK